MDQTIDTVSKGNNVSPTTSFLYRVPNCTNFGEATSSTAFNTTPEMITPPPPVLATPAMPPDWEKYYDDTSLSLNPGFQKFSVHPTSLEFMTILELVAPTQVLSAEKVVNPDLWQKYCNTRKEMIRAKTADLSLLSKLGLDEREVIRTSHHVLNYDRDPLLETDAGKYSPNEVLLFHCTRNKENLDKILRQGLDERMSSVRGGLLGKGIYFSDDPKKSMKYAGGTGVILIFTVLLGDCLCVDHIANAAPLVREPEKKEAQKRNFNDLFFDSITSRPNAGNEYVIYNRHQCCPLYMVKYQESNTTSILNGGENYDTSRRAIPPFAWTQLSPAIPPMPNQASDGRWPFYAVSVFEKMGVIPLPVIVNEPQPTPPAMDEDIIWFDPEDSDEDTDTNDKHEALTNLGFIDEVKNRFALKRYNNNLEDAASFLLDSEDSPLPPPTNSGALGQQSNQDEPMTTVDLTNNSSPDSSNGAAQNQNKEMVKERDDVPEESGQQSNEDQLMTTVDLASDNNPDSNNGVAQNQNPPSSQPPPTSFGAPNMTDTKSQQSNEDQLMMTTVDSNFTSDNSPDSSNGVAEDENKEKLEETDDVPEEVANRSLQFSNTPPTPPSMPEPVLPDLEECSICCNEYNSFGHSPSLWKELKCSHKLCLSCFQSIQTSGTTMSGVQYTSVRCPFCQGITGVEVGTCPNGKMTVTTNPASCEGYPSCGNIQINYMVSGKYRLNRVAYLPNNPEGNEVLKLLQTAWDRRLCFTIGNSNTTGAQDVLVWNIHHKTSLRGGVQAHGYPDPGYLERVKWEFKGYGIE